MIYTYQYRKICPLQAGKRRVSLWKNSSLVPWKNMSFHLQNFYYSIIQRRPLLLISEQSPYLARNISKAKELVLLLRCGDRNTCVSALSYYYKSIRDNVTRWCRGGWWTLGWRCSVERCGGGIVIDGGLHWIFHR